MEREVPLTIGMTEKQIADEKRLADELQIKIEAIEQGADKASKEELDSLKDWLANMRNPPSYVQDYYSVSIRPQKTENWKEPSYEQIAQIIKIPPVNISRKMMEKAPFRNFDFSVQKAIEYDAINLLAALFEYKVFDNDPISGVGMNIPITITSDQIPGQIAKTNNYEAIQYLLKNIDRMKSVKFQKNVIGSFRNIDRNRLDKECLDIFLAKAKEFKFESIYVDTSKWIGDDLPDDYDRWKNFKVPMRKSLSNGTKQSENPNIILYFTNMRLR